MADAAGCGKLWRGNGQKEKAGRRCSRPLFSAPGRRSSSRPSKGWLKGFEPWTLRATIGSTGVLSDIDKQLTASPLNGCTNGCTKKGETNNEIDLEQLAAELRTTLRQDRRIDYDKSSCRLPTRDHKRVPFMSPAGTETHSERKANECQRQFACRGAKAVETNRRANTPSTATTAVFPLGPGSLA